MVRFYAWLFVAGLLPACGDSPAPANSSLCGEPSRETTPVALDGAEPVCGEGGVGFAARLVGGGLVESFLLTRELGFIYVVVAPDCRFAAYAATQESNGTAVEGRLTQQQAEELDAWLSLEDWVSLDERYQWGACDGPVNSYYWGTRRTQHVSTCGGAQIDPPVAFPHDLQALVVQTFERLQPLGSPACGAVRFHLHEVEGQPNPALSQFTDAPRWPLGAGPEEFMVEDPASLHASVFVAEGADAHDLRRLRAARLAGEFGNARLGDAVPIHEPDGRLFRLYVRDVIEFERDGMHLVPWLEPEPALRTPLLFR